MRRLLLVLLAMFIGAIIGILQPVHGQEYTTSSIVCAPCDGADFGLSGTGIVVLASSGGGGWLYFYPLDRSQAVRFTPPQFGAASQLQTPAQLIGRFSSAGAPLVWSNKLK